MKRFVVYVGVAIILFLVTACGGSNGEEPESDRVLVLESGDVTEQAYRVRLRALFVNGEVWEPLCDEAHKSNFDEYFDLIKELDDSPPEQEAVRSDQERAFEIIREECDRRF